MRINDWSSDSALPIFTMSDQLASGIFKPLFERLRPSHNPALEGELHIVNNYRGGKFGFISSHAANVFALAFYLTILTKHNLKWQIGRASCRARVCPSVKIWVFAVSLKKKKKY